jgi:hypothetical protein
MIVTKRVLFCRVVLVGPGIHGLSKLKSTLPAKPKRYSFSTEICQHISSHRFAGDVMTSRLDPGTRKILRRY